MCRADRTEQAAQDGCSAPKSHSGILFDQVHNLFIMAFLCFFRMSSCFVVMCQSCNILAMMVKPKARLLLQLDGVKSWPLTFPLVADTNAFNLISFF